MRYKEILLGRHRMQGSMVLIIPAVTVAVNGVRVCVFTCVSV